MAEQESTPVTPVGPDGQPAVRPRVLPWLVLHTVGRLGIFALLTVVLWMVGLDLWSGLLFGLVLSMPVAYLLLRRSREQLSVALVMRAEERRREKERFRARLSGDAAA
jgi:MFS superfamily sulfate permease-like transporter